MRRHAWLLSLLATASAPALAQANWELALVGDIMMGTDFPIPRLPPNQGNELFLPALEPLRTADLTFGNLEGPLSSGGASSKVGCQKCYAFRTPPAYARHLKEAGFDAVSVANNHARDFGAEGQLQTTRTLDRHSIAWAGTLQRPMVILQDPSGRRCAFLAFSTGPAGPRVQDFAQARRLIGEAASQADLVVVSFHAGAEGASAGRTPKGVEHYHGENRGDVRAFAKLAVEAGADVVFGHGPHVPRGGEIIQGRVVLYSLGNFRTFGPFSKAGAMGLSPLVRVTVSHDGRFIQGKVFSYQQKGDGFYVDPSAAAAVWMQQRTREDFWPSLAIDKQGNMKEAQP